MLRFVRGAVGHVALAISGPPILPCPGSGWGALETTSGAAEACSHRTSKDPPELSHGQKRPQT
eukprot:7943886-Lingulodinium_polyedra.AAC.1